MSDEPRESRKSSMGALDALVREAKQDLTPHVDDAKWAALEERLVARMASPDERSRLVDEVRAPSTSRARVLRGVAFALAAAAAVAFVVKRDPGTTVLDGEVTAQLELTAGSLRSTEGPGEVRVAGQQASAGQVIRAGDLVEAAGGARAVLERPRKVTWLLERDAEASGRARVKSAGESLILGLEDGAIEAQVTPVPSGEAFAVDVAAGAHLVRVAVHGTHLRVARKGSRVVIDLSEGVVSIGVPPRTGTTYGTLVTAPSHVEFDAADLDGTLRVDHLPSSVRPPVSLASHEAPIAARADVPAEPPVHGASPPIAPEAVPRPSSEGRVPLPRAPEPSLVDPAAKVDEAKPAVPAREAIAAAVRECAAARSRPENVRVTVTSSLRLKIAPGGEVETAHFDPPLLPEIQTCAAAAIYKAKLAEASGGSVTIPIDFSY